MAKWQRTDPRGRGQARELHRTGDEGVAVAAGAKRTGLHEGTSWRQWHSSTRARLKVESETRARGKFTRVYYVYPRKK